MPKVVEFARQHWGQLLFPLGFLIGWKMDKRQDEKLSTFRNKSQLYSRELKPGEELTWT